MNWLKKDAFGEYQHLVEITILIIGMLAVGVSAVRRVPELEARMNTVEAKYNEHETKIAVLQNDISYIRQGMDTLLSDRRRRQ